MHQAEPPVQGWGAVSGFEAGVSAGRNGVSRSSVGVTGSDAGRMRPLETIGAAYEGRAVSGGGVFHRIVSVFAVGFRLMVPVLLLLTLAAASFVYGVTPVPGITDAGYEWLSLGLLVLPVSLFAIHLTNRRYGAASAFGQIFGSWAIALACMIYFADDIGMLRDGPMPSLRILGGFGAALFVAQCVSAFTFDRMRGPRWWQAPLMASIFGGLFFCVIGFPAAFAGTPVDWTGQMLTYGGVCFGWAVALLIPYWVLRPIIPPMSGFGGY